MLDVNECRRLPAGKWYLWQLEEDDGKKRRWGAIKAELYAHILKLTM